MSNTKKMSLVKFSLVISPKFTSHFIANCEL